MIEFVTNFQFWYYQNEFSVGSRMSAKIEAANTHKHVRFLADLQTFNYSFPCDVCEYETARKSELEDHLFYYHQIRVSFTHKQTVRKNYFVNRVEQNIDSVPKESRICCIFCILQIVSRYILRLFWIKIWNKCMIIIFCALFRWSWLAWDWWAGCHPMPISCSHSARWEKSTLIQYKDSKEDHEFTFNFTYSL